MKLARLVLTCVLAYLAPGIADAAVPETGMYWVPNENGKGTYIELQGNIVFVTMYAYHLDGTPVFYVGSNVLQPDSSGPPDWVPIQPLGIYPIPTVGIDLYEVTGGTCLACEGGGYDPPQKKGFIQIWWTWSAQPTVEIVLDGVAHHQPFELMRLNYGLATIGPSGPYKRVADVRGEWVFVEVTDPQAIPWRFKFDQREDVSADPFEVVFRDTQRSAEVRCKTVPTKQPGCELKQNGSVIFSAPIDDIGLSRMQAYRGDLLPRTGLVGRRAESVIGYRVNY